MSKIEVNEIVKQSGSTLTLGGPGTAVTLACGATQTGFGRTGTVDWCTTAKTSPFTSVSGKGYFINTTSGAVTVTLPSSPSAGDIVSIADYTNTFQTNSVTLNNNSSKIGGVCAPAILSTEGQSATFVYVDGTEGWKNVQDSTSNVTGTAFVTATGGTITTCGDYKIHTFTADGCFAVSALATAPADNKASYLVVAAGGGSQPNIGGGGGAGGFREGKLSTDPYTASPLAATPCSALTLTVATFPISVGGGGAGGSCAANGANSVFSTITSAGGGKSGRYPDSPAGTAGGSGGGAGGGGGGGGAGNTPPVSPPQGNSGGGSGNTFPAIGAGGGGGATAAGSSGSNPGGGAGGNGGGTGINPASPVGTPGPSGPLRYFAGGGGGGGYASNSGKAGGYGGGGNANSCGPGNGSAGTTNTGGGGGGQGNAGGSGIVMIRYKFQ